MKRTLALIVGVGIALSGCSNKDITGTPIELPSVAQSPSAIASEARTAVPSPSPTSKNTEPPKDPEVTKVPDSGETVKPTQTSDAGTPAVQFASRWGKMYPSVPEYAILKAANGVCIIMQEHEGWMNNPVARAGISEIVTGFGLGDKDVVAFAQDAEQNYCPSRV